MLDQFIHALVHSKNQAADDLLLQALRLGTEAEQRIALDALMARKTTHGLRGVLSVHDNLSEPLQEYILNNLRAFYHVLAECGRGEDARLRLSAIRLIAAGREGKLGYVLTENLHASDDAYSKAACDALLSLARWVDRETEKLQKNPSPTGEDADERSAIYQRLMQQRPEIESAVARAINMHRGKHGPDLLRAALLLADYAQSRTLAIVQTPRHGGQSTMIRRLQQTPSSEHVSAFLLASGRGTLRAHFGSVFSHIDEAPVLDALLKKTHWLKDNHLQICLGQVSRGVWWETSELARDLERRGALDAARIGQWIAPSSIHEVEQDERLVMLCDHANKTAATNPTESFDARLRLLRIAMSRKKGGSVKLLRALLTDGDVRITRMAVREIVRRKPPDYENILLKLMATAPASVRDRVGRAIGQAGFEQFWQRFDRLDPAMRKQAGRVMLKLLPDALQRLQRRAISGTPEQRVKALQIAQELGVVDSIRAALIQLCGDAHPRVRSKATALLTPTPEAPNDALVDRLVHDTDARVRANAIEVIEGRGGDKVISLLAERALAANGRERGNAIKALCRMKVSTASKQLLGMLRDQRPEHRISAMWVLRQIGWWQMINEVGRLAKSDDNIRVRRYAIGVLKTVAELVREQKQAV